MTNRFDLLVDAFLLYAEHLSTCNTWLHKHKSAIDRRATCTSGACTCGLLSVLTMLQPDIKYVTPCPDALTQSAITTKHLRLVRPKQPE
jgi:hypothetical protein